LVNKEEEENKDAPKSGDEKEDEEENEEVELLNKEEEDDHDDGVARDAMLTAQKKDKRREKKDHGVEESNRAPNRCFKKYGLSGTIVWEDAAYYPWRRNGKYLKKLRKENPKKAEEIAKQLTDITVEKDEQRSPLSDFIKLENTDADSDAKKTTYKYDCNEEDQKETGLCKLMRKDNPNCECREYPMKKYVATGCKDNQLGCKLYGRLEAALLKNGMFTGTKSWYEDLHVRKKVGNIDVGDIEFSEVMVKLECNSNQFKFELIDEPLAKEEFEKKANQNVEEKDNDAQDDEEEKGRRRRLLHDRQGGC
jgi:hypothetical protein